jgi:CheY-like chemotaxis protein
MPAQRSAPVVAVFNASEEVVGMLRAALEAEGFHTISAHVPDIKRGQEDLLAFLEKHDPPVIIYDISLPYEENWTFLRLIMDLESAKGRQFVVTTTNKRALEELVGPTPTFELVGKPYDLEQIIAAVRQALEAPRRRA